MTDTVDPAEPADLLVIVVLIGTLVGVALPWVTVTVVPVGDAR